MVILAEICMAPSEGRFSSMVQRVYVPIAWCNVFALAQFLLLYFVPKKTWRLYLDFLDFIAPLLRIWIIQLCKVFVSKSHNVVFVFEFRDGDPLFQIFHFDGESFLIKQK